MPSLGHTIAPRPGREEAQWSVAPQPEVGWREGEGEAGVGEGDRRHEMLLQGRKAAPIAAASSAWCAAIQLTRTSVIAQSVTPWETHLTINCKPRALR